MIAEEPSSNSQLVASLSNWKSNISLMFSNASPMNLEPAKALASLLMKSGFVEGSHLCHILLGTGVFGSNPDQTSFELLGSDPSLPGGFGRDVDSILLSMTLEFYKNTIEPTAPSAAYSPHLILYKLNLVAYLIDRGNVVEAQTLFDSVTGIVKACGKNSVFSPEIFDYIDIVAQRLNLTPQTDSTGGWFSSKLGRPKLDKVLGHLDKSFSKFVTGDDAAPTSESQDGIFKKLAETPIPSRAQSTVDLVSNPYMSPGRPNPYGPPETHVNELSPGSLTSRTNSVAGLIPQATNRDTRPYSPYGPTGSSSYNIHQKTIRPFSPLKDDIDHNSIPGAQVSRPKSTAAEFDGLQMQTNSQRSNSTVNPYSPSASNSVMQNSEGVSSYNPYAPQQLSQSTSDKEKSAEHSDNQSYTSESFPSNSQGIASTQMTASNSYNPYAPPTSMQTSSSNPYSSAPDSRPQSTPINPYSAAPDVNHSASNPYLPASNTSHILNPEEDSHNHLSTDGNQYSVPGYNPYSTNYETAKSPKADPNEDTGFNYTNQSNPETSYESYNPPQYGYSNEDDSQNFSSYEPPSNVNVSMENTFHESNNSEYLHNPPQNSYEDDDEDLGFANNSFKKKKPDESEEAKKNAEEAEKKEAEKGKKGWFSWIRKGNNDDSPKPVQIKLGEEMALVYDPELKRYVNKNAPKEELKPSAPTPPPPPPSGPTHTPSNANSQAPPAIPGRSSSAIPVASSPIASGPPSIPNSARNSPAIPTSGGLDDLLAAAPTVGRKAGRRNARSRYVDVMSQTQQK